MVQIDISGVPVERREDPRFIHLQSDMQSAVNDPAWQAAFAIHEAGHKIYTEKMGTTGFDFVGPNIIYDEVIGDFIGCPAAVKAQNITPQGADPIKWLHGIAKAKAAGGVFARRLTVAPNQGDEGDREEFARACDMLREKSSGIKIDEDAIWKQAQDEILKDLRKPAFHGQCWDEANKIKAQLFGS